MALRKFPVDCPRLGLHWTVVDDAYLQHDLAADYLTELRFGRGSARGTVRNYAGNLTVFLNWQESTGRSAEQAARDLSRFILHLRLEPIAKGRRGAGRPRSGDRIEKICITVREYYKYLVAVEAVDPKVIRYIYELVDTGASYVGTSSVVRHQGRVRHKVPKSRPVRVQPATNAECEALLRACRTWRDRYLLVLLMNAGLRIGQAVGLHREDQHFVDNSTKLGCPIEGPHLHVRRREENPNGAVSKTMHSYHVPVDHLTQTCYERYLMERDACRGAADSDFVFVNLKQGHVGGAMTTDGAEKLFVRLCRRADLQRAVTPHMLRHTMASDQVEAGTPLAVLAELLGHRSLTSTMVYVHASDEAKRQAVLRAGSARGGR